ncbi:MAG TPA: DNA polymerase beta [Chloroflexi bacterium]|nr:DNA polymerase beta [Chloroflexota bacterium]
MAKKKALGELLEDLRRLYPVINERYKVASLGVFGSYVRKEQDEESDLDVLVTFHETPSLLRFVELENFLADELGVKVDLVMRDALKPEIGRRIMHQVIAV